MTLGSGKDDTNSAKLCHALEQFGERTSIHGFNYVFSRHGRNEGVGRAERLFWIVVTVLGTIVAFQLSFELLERRRRSPTLTTIDTTAYPISKIDFPTVNLCAAGSVNMESKLEAYFGEMAFSDTNGDSAKAKKAIALLQEHIKGWPDETTMQDLILHLSAKSNMDATRDLQTMLKNSVYSPDKTPHYESLLDRTRPEVDRLQEEVYFEELIRTYSQSENISAYAGNYEKMMELLFVSTRKCSEFIKRCTWNGQVVDCNEFFHLSPTDAGFCCTFNLEDAVIPEDLPMYKVLKKFAIKEAGRVNSESASSLGYDLSPVAGRRMGLEVVMDAHSDLVSRRSVGDIFEGFVAAVTARREGVTVMERGFLVPPGHYTQVAISATNLDVEEGFREALEPMTRKCYFPDEHKLASFSRYSTSRCMIQCGCDMAFEATGCSPWNVPRNTTEICNPAAQVEFFNQYYLRGSKHPSCGDCLPDCEITSFTQSVTSAPFRRCDGLTYGSSVFCLIGKFDDFEPQMWADLAIQELGNRSSLYNLTSPMRRMPADGVFTSALGENSTANEYNAFEKDVAVVRFFFDRGTIPSFRRSVRISPTVFLSELGGIFGLCLGCSIVSFIEVVFWLVYKVAVRITGV